MNTLVITSHGLAMLFEHGKLLLHAGRVIAHIAGIGVLRHQLERHLLAVATDQQRNMWLLDALGLVNGTTHLIILALAGTARSRNIHQIERANVQLPYFRETSQGLDQDRHTRTGGSPEQAFEIRDAGFSSAPGVPPDQCVVRESRRGLPAAT